MKKSAMLEAQVALLALHPKWIQFDKKYSIEYAYIH
jgi:hypothetical protein